MHSEQISEQIRVETSQQLSALRLPRTRCPGSRRPLFMAVLVAALVGGAAAGPARGDDRDDGPPPDAEKTESPYFFVEGASTTRAFPLKSTKVSAMVSGVIANVVVKQAYENTGSSPLNAAMCSRLRPAPRCTA